MMQVIPRWRVIVSFKVRDSVVFWVNDNFIANVLRIVSGLQFCEGGLDQPTSIVVAAELSGLWHTDSVTSTTQPVGCGEGK